MLWDKPSNQSSTWYTDTPLGRYLIKRSSKGSREFRIYHNNKPTKHSGTLEELKQIVERIAVDLYRAGAIMQQEQNGND